MKDQKDKLLSLIKKGRKNSQLVVKRASKVLEYSQYISDFADASEKVITLTPSMDFRLQINSWHYLNQNLEAINRGMEPTNFSLAASSCSTALSTMADFAQPEQIIKFALPNNKDEAWAAAVALGSVIDKMADKVKALDLLHKFKLSTAAPNGKSAVALLETACAAFERPVTQEDPVSTSLIPMRECINTTIATLLRRRPKQEPAKSQKDKIISIGNQTALDGVPDWAISSMAERWDKLLDKLSSSKKADIHRSTWRATLQESLLFLIEFLQSLDQTKMK